jgi:negative regulator of sigma-B (phosphoserine phosphatase)
MTDPAIDIGVAQRARSGERESGDRCVVKTSARRTLIGVIDGVGHGPEAARAADAAAEVLETFAGESVGPLLQRCHERLRRTRGAAITLIILDVAGSAAEWAGAGNVAVVLLQADSSGKKHLRELLVRSGIVGSLLPTTEGLRLALRGGDMVVLATDGVHRAFIDGLAYPERAQRLAERLLGHYGIAEDDALVVVARLAERVE